WKYHPNTGSIVRPWTDAEKAMQPFGELAWADQDVLESEHQHLFARKPLQVRREQVGVQPAGKIGERTCKPQTLRQFLLALRFEAQRCREVLGLEAGHSGPYVIGIRAIGRLPNNEHELHPGQLACDPFGWRRA